MPGPTPTDPHDQNPIPSDGIYWLGGSPCSGKSTLSRLLCAEFGLELYAVDENYPRHATQLNPEQHPTLVRWSQQTWEERWMQPLEALLSEAYNCYREHFSLVLEDLAALAGRHPLLVEGTALLPGELARLAIDPRRALWMVPSPEFQLNHYTRREFVRGILAECRHPQAAFDNWMARDAQFARQVTAEAHRLGYRVIVVDGSQTIEHTARQVAQHFRLPAWG